MCHCCSKQTLCHYSRSLFVTILTRSRRVCLWAARHAAPPPSEPNFTDSHIERQVQKQQGVTRVQLHLSCGLFIIQVDACWRQFSYFSCLSKRVGGVIQFNFETNPTLCTQIGKEDYKKVLVKYINFSYRKCLSSQWQLVLWPRISLPPSQGVFGFVLFIITVMRVFVISIFGWEKYQNLPSRIVFIISKLHPFVFFLFSWNAVLGISPFVMSQRPMQPASKFTVFLTHF